jgi:iron complex outermembrane receptor protein
MLGNLIHLSERNTTFDGSGGEAFVVPDVTLYGAKVGFEMPDESWSVFVEGRNLADEIYAADFAANASVPRAPRPPFAPTASPDVRPGDGRAFFAGMTMTF